MPLNRDRMRELKSNLDLNEVVKPNRDTLSELRDMMKDISGVRGGMTLYGDHEADDDWTLDIDDGLELLPDVDGNLIPDF